MEEGVVKRKELNGVFSGSAIVEGCLCGLEET